VTSLQVERRPSIARIVVAGLDGGLALACLFTGISYLGFLPQTGDLLDELGTSSSTMVDALRSNFIRDAVPQLATGVVLALVFLVMIWPMSSRWRTRCFTIAVLAFFPSVFVVASLTNVILY
jgi:hypothetical protein